MHILKFLHKPDHRQQVLYGMAAHSEFLITSAMLMDFHCDLGGCVIQTAKPRLVAKIHAFKTQVNDKRLRKKYDDERFLWLLDKFGAMETAKEITDSNMTVREYMKQTGQPYDVWRDEPRMIAKVPGLNIYLELLGSMDEEDTAMERLWQAEEQQSTMHFNRYIGRQAFDTLNRMAVFYRQSLTKGDRQAYATQETDWQPRDDWEEMYDPTEQFPSIPRRGIGFDKQKKQQF